MIRKLYPYGKKKAFNLTYDDGVTQDVRFVELLNRYGLKGTFNLNSGLMESEFEWIHESGMVVKRLNADTARTLYDGHEVASHTLSHPYMHALGREETVYELSRDKAELEKLFGREIKGFALPFDYFSELIKSCVIDCGFEYARISEETYSFRPGKDYYSWGATVFHCRPGLMELSYGFLNTHEELALFQIVGHSYDLDTENMWELMERVFELISARDDILPMTTIEIIDYLKAMDKAELTDMYIQNNSNLGLWFAVNNTVREVKPGERLDIA